VVVTVGSLRLRLHVRAAAYPNTYCVSFASATDYRLVVTNAPIVENTFTMQFWYVCECVNVLCCLPGCLSAS
jgi:hypothetical protein